MTRIQPALRPFGQAPARIAVQLERAFATWRAVVGALERTSSVLVAVGDRLRLSAACGSALVRLRECHVCAGVSAGARPCLGFCLNVLRGCLAEVAELEPQWADLIGSFIKVVEMFCRPNMRMYLLIGSLKREEIALGRAATF